MNGVATSLLVFCAAGAVGCASLDVDVSVFDRSCLTELDFLRAQALDHGARLRALQAAAAYDAAEREIVAKARQAEEELACVGGTSDPRDYCLDPADVASHEFSAAVGAAVHTKLDDAKAKARETLAKLDTAELIPASDVAGQKAAYADVLAAYVASDNAVRTLGTAVRSEIGNKGGDAVERLLLLASRVEVTLQSRNDLSSDHLASAIANADDVCWEADYNEAFALGVAGNSDFAIKMESDSEYTIKGARLDASKLTRATFGAVRQGIAIAAAAYGVPLPAAQQKSSAPLADAIPELDSARVAEQELEARARLSRLAIWGFLEAVVERRDELDAAATRKATFRTLQGVFRVYRAQIAGESPK